MQPTIPNFESEEWNERRIQLQEELGLLAEKLIDHMAAPGGMRGQFEFETTDGRPLTLTIEAGERQRGH